MGQLKTKDPKQNKVVFCCGLLYLRNKCLQLKTPHLNRLLQLLMLHMASFLGNSPLSVCSFSDHFHLCAIIVYCENKYSLLLDNRTHARRLCELTTRLQCSVKMTKETLYDCFLMFGINCSVSLLRVIAGWISPALLGEKTFFFGLFDQRSYLTPKKSKKIVKNTNNHERSL